VTHPLNLLRQSKQNNTFPNQQARYDEEFLLGHAYHTYKLSSPDNTVSFEFQHNVCGGAVHVASSCDP
jgi:hypothetical protein